MSTIPEPLRSEALTMAAELAAVAGDEAAVLDVIEEYVALDGLAEVQRLIGACLVLTYAECVTRTELHPTPTEGALS